MCITELVDGMVNVLHAEEYPRPDFSQMIKTTVHLLEKYNIRFDNSCRIFVDAANPSFISTMKQAVNEDPDYTKQIQYYKHNYPSITTHQYTICSFYNITCLLSPSHSAKSIRICWPTAKNYLNIRMGMWLYIHVTTN